VLEVVMTRLESAAWPLAFGGASVFVLAVVLDRLSWQVAFAAVAVAVVGWAWRSPVMVGAAIGGIGWLCVTGFDVHRFGYIGTAGGDDLVRVAVLVLLGVLAGSVHAVAEAVRSHRSADPVRVEPAEADLELRGRLDPPNGRGSHPAGDSNSALVSRDEQRIHRDG
jgi:hypothetical protein